MARAKTKSLNEKTKKMRPALTPEARESQLISLAVNLAEQQLLDGTASSQVITHFLKLGTEKAKLEQEKLRQETEMMKAKTESLQSSKHIEELYANAIEAMQGYKGSSNDEEYAEFCYKNDYLTSRGVRRYTAEILYRFITNDNNFIESHTGLEDVMIEKEIFVECMRRGATNRSAWD